MAENKLTLAETWAASPEASKWLKDTLSSPMGQFFLSVLEERSELRLNTAMPPQFLTANGTALSGRILGYESCLNNIRALSEPSAILTKPIVETYGVTKENATE